MQSKNVWGATVALLIAAAGAAVVYLTLRQALAKLASVDDLLLYVIIGSASFLVGARWISSAASRAVSRTVEVQKGERRQEMYVHLLSVLVEEVRSGHTVRLAALNELLPQLAVHCSPRVLKELVQLCNASPEAAEKHFDQLVRAMRQDGGDTSWNLASDFFSSLIFRMRNRGTFASHNPAQGDGNGT